MGKEFDVAVIETKDFEYFMVACSKDADVQSKKNVLMQVLPPEAKYQSIEVYRTSDLAYAYSVIRHSSEGNQLIFRTKIDFANAPEVFVINGAVLFVEKRQVNARAFLGYEKFFFSTVRAFDTRLGDPLDVDFGRLESCDEIFVNAKGNKYAVSGNILGDEDAKLVVYTYTDFNCPICEAYNIMIHKAAKELKGVKFVHKNLPLDTECNPFLKAPFHYGSCTMARYAMAAEKQGKFWAVNSKFFELHPQSEEEILKIAKDLKLDTEKLKQDANSKEIRDELAKEIEMAASQGINGTPATKVGNEVFVGIKPYSKLIEILEDAGATRR